MNTLTMRIACDCGNFSRINGIRQDDLDHAMQRARENGWHSPRVILSPMADAMIVGVGVCDECYLDSED